MNLEISNYLLVAFFMSLALITVGLPLVLTQKAQPLSLLKYLMLSIVFSILWATFIKFESSHSFIEVLLIKTYIIHRSNWLMFSYSTGFALSILMVVSIIKSWVVRSKINS
jgi:hypothetical protein